MKPLSPEEGLQRRLYRKMVDLLNKRDTDELGNQLASMSGLELLRLVRSGWDYAYAIQLLGDSLS